MAEWVVGKGPRLQPAWHAALDLLADGEAHTWDETITVMLRASDLTMKTCDGLLYQGVQHGHIKATGRGRSRTFTAAKEGR